MFTPKTTIAPLLYRYSGANIPSLGSYGDIFVQCATVSKRVLFPDEILMSKTSDPTKAL